MAVPVRAEAGPKPSFETDAAVPLFEAHIDTSTIAMHYDVTSDGTRFFIETKADAAVAPMTVWVNWLHEHPATSH